MSQSEGHRERLRQMKSGSPPLPEMLKPLFWDVDFSALDWQTDRDLIVRRILQKGGWPAVRWLRSFWGDQAIRRWLEEHAGGRLSPRQLRYWELVLNLPEHETDDWIARAKDSLWEKRVQTAPSTQHGQVEGVRVSFLEFRYPLLSPVVHWEETGASLASLDDLACMKLSAIAQRGSKKDFFDVYALCSTHRPLEQMLALYLEKFSVTDISPVLYGLVYFDDADQERDPLLLQKIEWSQVKRAFQKWVKAIQ